MSLTRKFEVQVNRIITTWLTVDAANVDEAKAIAECQAEGGLYPTSAPVSHFAAAAREVEPELSQIVRIAEAQRAEFSQAAQLAEATQPPDQYRDQYRKQWREAVARGDTESSYQDWVSRMPMLWRVMVSRTATRHAELDVWALNEDEARSVALEAAADRDFSSAREDDAEYDSQGAKLL